MVCGRSPTKIFGAVAGRARAVLDTKVTTMVLTRCLVESKQSLVTLISTQMKKEDRADTAAQIQVQIFEKSQYTEGPKVDER